MHKSLITAALLFIIPTLVAQPANSTTPSPSAAWKSKVNQSLPRLGHRNWILIVDSAYPLQTSSGIETVETNASQIDVLRYVLASINSSIHVRPVITMDAELPFLTDKDAPGVTAYRKRLISQLNGLPVESLLHDRIIASIAEAASQFHVLVLKTNLTIPYTSVFIRLDCKYWASDAESRLRAKIAAAAQSPTPTREVPNN